MATPPKDKKSDKPKGKKPGGGPPGQDQQQYGPPQPGMMPGPQNPPVPGTPMDPFEAMALGMAGGQQPMIDPMFMQMLMGGGGMGGPGAGMPMDAMGMGGGDPYAVPPGYSQQALSGIGVADPQMGLQQILEILALAQAGVAPGSPVTSSGVMMDPDSDIMAGMDPRALLSRTGGF